MICPVLRFTALFSICGIFGNVSGKSRVLMQHLAAKARYNLESLQIAGASHPAHAPFEESPTGRSYWHRLLRSSPCVLSSCNLSDTAILD